VVSALHHAGENLLGVSGDGVLHLDAMFFEKASNINTIRIINYHNVKIG
jgi:hypothetical protein